MFCWVWSVALRPQQQDLQKATLQPQHKEPHQATQNGLSGVLLLRLKGSLNVMLQKLQPQPFSVKAALTAASGSECDCWVAQQAACNESGERPPQGICDWPCEKLQPDHDTQPAEQRKRPLRGTSRPSSPGGPTYDMYAAPVQILSIARARQRSSCTKLA